MARTARSIDLTRAASPGDLTWASFAPSDAGGAMLAFESGFTPIELPAAQFEKYLGDEGLDGPLATRRRAHSVSPGRERYRRCAKTWIAGSAAGRATAAIGMPLEIVPLSVPGADATLRARVLWNGHPLAGALVKAWRSTVDTDSVAVAWSARTDARGEVAVPLSQTDTQQHVSTNANSRAKVSINSHALEHVDGALWLLSVVTMVPCPDRAEADWESTWASLTFAR